jgi:hypothetical protein
MSRYKESIQKDMWDLYVAGRNIGQISDEVGVPYGEVDRFLTAQLIERRVAAERKAEEKVPVIVIPPRKTIHKRTALNDYNYIKFVVGDSKIADTAAIENETVGTFNHKTYAG